MPMHNSQSVKYFLSVLVIASIASGNASSAYAQEKAAADRGPAPKPVELLKDAKANPYCANIADAAADARFAWQKETLASLEKQIEGRIKVLEEKRAEYEVWLKRRNEFLAKADEGVVAIYARMRPDAAALQLANMHDETAAAILTKLSPRNASAVLNEMEPARAAQLTNVITDTTKRTQENEKSG
ncbi:MotE family protein [Microvirga sp. BT350]|uniref:MotE family protein n=2 Tax=Microvirga alba TaxID=2791025 RepID=A0A931BMH8_9HYPH|nr:MotE family protein [Microvirga alba]